MPQTQHRGSLRLALEKTPARFRALTTVTCAVVLVIATLAARPAFALTDGLAIATPFPRIASWWPDNDAPDASLARMGYIVPSEPLPLMPDLQRIAALRALNPAAVLFADANACELKYRQPDSSGLPIGADSYDAELIGAIPTSWILTQVGSTLSAPITTVVTPLQVIAVADSASFRTGDLVIIDAEKCLVVSVASGTLTVRRGWAGSCAADHTSGTRIASAVSSWPYTVRVDVTDECPPGRATGQMATPGTGDELARDWMVRRAAAFSQAADFDGVAVDLSVGYISWFQGTGTYQFRTIASRSNPDVEVDYGDFDDKWASALHLFQLGLRSSVVPGTVVLANEGTPEFGALNGSRIEEFPQKTTSPSRWYRKVIGPNKEQYPSYLEWCSSGRQPNFTTIQTYGDTATDYQLMRFGLTTALMGDGFYAFAPRGSNQLQDYDEFDNAGAGKGYLGSPVGEMRSAVPPLSTPDLVSGDGAFADATDLGAWTFYSRVGYAATRVLDEGTVRIDVTQSDGWVGGVELYRPNVAVTAGTPYTLSFRARADRPLSLQTQVQQGSSPWTTYMAAYDDKMLLGTEWRTFELPMTSSGTDAAAVLKLTTGESVGTIWVDDVKLQAGARNIYRRDFEGGVALVNPSDRAVTIDLGGSFRKIMGSQAPLVNDGSLVSAVTLPARDGLVLLGPAPVVVSTPPAPVLPTPTATSRPAGPSKARLRKKLTLKGTVAPAGTTGTVTIVKTRLVGRRWKSAGTARVSLVNGSYRYSFKPTKRGTWRFVAKYSGTWDGATGYSASTSLPKSARVR